MKYLYFALIIFLGFTSCNPKKAPKEAVTIKMYLVNGNTLTNTYIVPVNTSFKVVHGYGTYRLAGMWKNMGVFGESGVCNFEIIERNTYLTRNK